MLTEQNLVNGEVLASDDLDGVNTMIQTLFNEIAKKRVRVIQLHREKKSQEALELQATANDMSEEMDSLIKSQMNYLKYLKAIGQVNKQQPTGVSSQLKNQKSSNGDIVASIPKA